MRFVVVLTLLFVASLIMIRDVDRPFTGLVHVGSDAIQMTREHIADLYAHSYGLESLPCDQQGHPKTSAGE